MFRSSNDDKRGKQFLFDSFKLHPGSFFTQSVHRPLFMPHPEIQVGVLGERYPEIPGTNPLYTPTF